MADLSHQQFGPYAPRAIFRESDDATDLYHYAQEDRGSISGWRNHMSLVVTHSRPHNVYAYGDKPDVDGPQYRDLRKSHAEGVPKLFGHHRFDGSSQVYVMEGTKESRAMALPMIGVAALHTQRDRGRMLEAPSDLSPHSVRLVQRLNIRGVKTGRDDPEETNDMDFREATIWHPEWRDRRVDPGDVASGKKIGRSLVRGNPPDFPKSSELPPPELPKPSSYKQGTLF